MKWWEKCRGRIQSFCERGCDREEDVSLQRNFWMLTMVLTTFLTTRTLVWGGCCSTTQFKTTPFEYALRSRGLGIGGPQQGPKDTLDAEMDSYMSTTKTGFSLMSFLIVGNDAMIKYNEEVLFQTIICYKILICTHKPRTDLFKYRETCAGKRRISHEISSSV